MLFSKFLPRMLYIFVSELVIVFLTLLVNLYPGRYLIKTPTRMTRCTNAHPLLSTVSVWWQLVLVMGEVRIVTHLKHTSV